MVIDLNSLLDSLEGFFDDRRSKSHPLSLWSALGWLVPPNLDIPGLNRLQTLPMQLGNLVFAKAFTSAYENSSAL